MRIFSGNGLRKEVLRQVSPEIMRVLWTLRMSCMKLKPDVPEEDDYVAFCEFLRHESVTTVVFRERGTQDADGIAGFFCLLKCVSGAASLIGYEYLFFSPRYRGGSLLIMIFLRVTCDALCIWLTGKMPYFCAVTYPPSYALMRLAHGDRPIFAQTASEREKRILDRYGAMVGDYDSASRTCNMRTLPRQGAASRYVDEFETFNPRWRSGVGLVAIIPVTLVTACHLFALAMKRNFRKR